MPATHPNQPTRLPTQSRGRRRGGEVVRGLVGGARWFGGYAIGLLADSVAYRPSTPETLAAHEVWLKIVRASVAKFEFYAGAFANNDPVALAIASVGLLHLCCDFEAASGAIARALALNGSCATALYFGAHIHAFGGDAALAEDYAVRALRLSPFDSMAWEGFYSPGLVHIRNQRFDEAASSVAKAVQLNSRFSWLYAVHAAALALAGRSEDAKSVAKRVLELEPNFHVGPMEASGKTFMVP